MDCTKGSFSTLRHKAIKAVNNNFLQTKKPSGKQQTRVSAYLLPEGLLISLNHFQ